MRYDTFNPTSCWFLFGEILDWNPISHNYKFAKIFAYDPTSYHFSEIFDQNSISQSLIWEDSDAGQRMTLGGH